MFSVQLYQFELCNGEAMCSLCSFINLSFVMGRRCVFCAALSRWALKWVRSVFSVRKAMSYYNYNQLKAFLL